MRILYGIEKTQYDVTNICYTKLLNGNEIIIPSNDGKRAEIFTDPCVNVRKNIFIIDEQNNKTVYDDSVDIIINTSTNTVSVQYTDSLYEIRSKLKIKYGSFSEEEPEQKMAHKFITGHEKVLEIGGNIGRNSLIIGSILQSKMNPDSEDPLQFVTLECDKNIAEQLIENRDLNNLNFFVENSALSKRRLIQKGWDTIPVDDVNYTQQELERDGYSEVKTITWDELNEKYKIKFDTLVLDCEGAFYYILKDTPEILDNINLIIMENDYHVLENKQYVDSILVKYGFNVVYSESGGWGCCVGNFFEVWKKK